MAFKLINEFVHATFDPAADGNWLPFLQIIDEDVEWIIADPEPHDGWSVGTFNLQQWKEKIHANVFTKLDPDTPARMAVDCFDIIGETKLIVEASGYARQRNGREYNNKFCWIFIFDKATGKVVKIREYMNTALVEEVKRTN